jgi:hypothetical protein
MARPNKEEEETKLEEYIYFGNSGQNKTKATGEMHKQIHSELTRFEALQKEQKQSYAKGFYNRLINGTKI